jgi:hypothetical protein
MKPTYSTQEALILMLSLDLDSLLILGKLIIEESDRYSDKEFNKIFEAYAFCTLEERIKAKMY